MLLLSNSIKQTFSNDKFLLENSKTTNLYKMKFDDKFINNASEDHQNAN